MSILFGLLGALFFIVCLVVLFSCAIVWYELSNEDPELIKKRFAAGQILFALRLLAMEAFFLFVTVLLHPLGWIPTQKETTRGGDIPIILLHGLFHNKACWLWVQLVLRRNGFTNLHTLNLPPWKNVEALTEKVANKVDLLRQSGGVEKVHLVGHSMGAIIARNYLQIRGGAQKVDRCVLLGAPNAGSKLAPFTVTPLGKELVPGSDFLKRLSDAPLPEGAVVTSIYSRHDNMVLPCANARLEKAGNVELEGIGHASLLYHPDALEKVVGELKGGSQ